MQEVRFRAALACLGDQTRTTIVLVARPDGSALREAARTSAELSALGLRNQLLAVNGRFRATKIDDPIAVGIEQAQDSALSTMPVALSTLPRDEFPMLLFDIVGLDALRALFTPGSPVMAASGSVEEARLGLPPLGTLVDEIAEGEKSLVMVMGRGASERRQSLLRLQSASWNVAMPFILRLPIRQHICPLWSRERCVGSRLTG